MLTVHRLAFSRRNGTNPSASQTHPIAQFGRVDIKPRNPPAASTQQLRRHPSLGKLRAFRAFCTIHSCTSIVAALSLVTLLSHSSSGNGTCYHQYLGTPRYLWLLLVGVPPAAV